MRPSVLAFLSGTVAGAVAASAALLLTDDPGGAPIDPSISPSASAAASIGDSATSPGAPTANPTTEAAEATADDSGTRTAVEASAKSGTDPSTLPAKVESKAIDAALLAEFEILMDSGGLRAYFAKMDDPAKLRFLLRTWLSAEQPQRALEVAHRLQDRLDGRSMSSLSSIAKALEKAGDTAGALAACMLALRKGMSNNDLINRALKIDPAAVLAVMQATEPTGNKDEWLAARTLALMRNGKIEEALALADTAEEPLSARSNIWSALVDANPAIAEKRLLALIDQGSDNQWRLYDLLKKSLASQKREGEFVAVLKARLERDPDDTTASQKLAETDKAAALAWLRDRVRTDRSGSFWCQYGEQLIESGDRRTAIDALWRATDLGGETNAPYLLLEHAPNEAIPRLREVAERRRDDEMLGDIADKLWEQGNRQSAIELWESAHKYDRGDSEWTNKLRRARRNKNPLGR